MMSQLDYFSEFLKVAPMSHALWRCGEATKLLSMVKNWHEPVLDLGCGFGEFMGVFFDNQIEIGLDINDRDLVQAARCKKYGQCKLADARKLPFDDKSIQTIVSVSVLEHIPMVNKVFEEVSRVLKPGGYFIFTVPTILINKHLVGVQILQKLGLSNLANSYNKSFHQAFKHHNIWTYKKWITLLKDSGFSLIDYQSTLSVDQLHLFEYGLLPALPSQIARNVFGSRLIVDSFWRQRFWSDRVKSILQETPELPLNVAIIGKKS